MSAPSKVVSQVDIRADGRTVMVVRRATLDPPRWELIAPDERLKHLLAFMEGPHLRMFDDESTAHDLAVRIAAVYAECLDAETAAWERCRVALRGLIPEADGG